MIAGLPDLYQRPMYNKQEDRFCWGIDDMENRSGQKYTSECQAQGDGRLGLCRIHEGRIIPNDLVGLEPCPSFRYPLEGDMFRCAACGYWDEDHS